MSSFPSGTTLTTQHLDNATDSPAKLTAQAGLLEGQVAYCSNGNSGSPCLAVYNGSNWLVVSIGSTPIST